MPTYHYRCAKCGHENENLVQPISQFRATTQCPACGSASFENQIVSGRPEFNPGTRVEYPLRDWQLPPDPHTRRSRIVQSAAQHRDLAKAAGMEINQGYERDSYGGD